MELPMLTFEKKDTTKASVNTWDMVVKSGTCLKDPEFCGLLMLALMENAPDKEDAQITCSEYGINFTWKVARIPANQTDKEYIEKEINGPVVAVADIFDEGCSIELRQFFDVPSCIRIILDTVGDWKTTSMKRIVSAVAKALYTHVKYDEAKTALLKVLGDLGYVEGKTGSEGDTEPSSGEEK
jgi:hypothetical protein